MPIIKFVRESNWNHWSIWISIQQTYHYTHHPSYHRLYRA